MVQPVYIARFVLLSSPVCGDSWLTLVRRATGHTTPTWHRHVNPAELTQSYRRSLFDAQEPPTFVLT